MPSILRRSDSLVPVSYSFISVRHQYLNTATPYGGRSNAKEYGFNNAAQGPAGTYTEDLNAYVTAIGLVGGDTLSSITLTGQQTWVKVYANEIVPSAAAITFGHTTEKKAADNYEITYTPANLTIKQAYGKVTITKTWQKPAGENAPEVTFTVTGGPQDYTGRLASDKTIVVIDELPMSSEDGLYSYSVSESKLNEYRTTSSGDISFTLTPKSNEKTASFTNTKNEATYVVEYYYQDDDGNYAAEASEISDARTGETGKTVSVTDDDKAAKQDGKYVYDAGAENVESATLAADGTTKLKLYFKLNQVDVTVEHYLKGTENAFKTDTIAGQTVGSTYTATPETKYPERDLTINNTDPVQPITVKANGNVIKIYYTIPLTIAAYNVEQKYNGNTWYGDYRIDDSNYLSQNDYQAISEVIADQTIVASATDVSEQTYPSKEEKAKIIGDSRIPSYYDLTITEATLKITPREIIVTDNMTVVYNGNDQTLTIDANEATGVVSGETLTLTGATITGRNVGEYTTVGAYTWSVTKENGSDSTGNYTISVTGKLTITPASVQLMANSDTKVYNGAEQSVSGYTSSVKGLTFEGVSAGASGTTVGNYTATFTGVTLNVTTDTTGNYVVTGTSDGTLAITPRTVTVSVEDKTVEYNGKEQYGNREYAFKNIVTGHTATISYDPSYGTVPDTYENGGYNNVLFQVKDADNNDVTSNYVLGTTTVGKLIITDRQTKYALTIEANSNTGNVYDGTQKSAVGYVVKYNGETVGANSNGIGETLITVEGVDYKLSEVETTNPSSIIVIKAPNAVSGTVAVKDAGGNDVTGQFTVTTKDGELEIKPKPLTITADSDKKVYDGAALTKDSYTNTDLASGDSIASVTVTGSQTVVGKSDNVPSAAKIVNGAGEDVTASYAIGYVNGILEVTAKAVTITADSADKVYDGTALTKNSYTNTALASGDSIESVTVNGSRTVVGESDNVPSVAKIVNGAGEDVTGSYTITYANGTLEAAIPSRTRTVRWK